MVVFILYIKADLEGVATMALDRTANLCISVRNPLSDFEVREKVVISPGELEEPEKNTGSLRGYEIESPHHFALKWDGAQERSTIEILDGTSATAKKHGKKGNQGHASANIVHPKDMSESDSGNFVPVLALECHGLEPYDFHPMGGEFIVTSKCGVKFNQVDLSEGDWNEFELASGSCSITNFQSKFM